MRTWLGGLLVGALLVGAPAATASTVYTPTPQSPYTGSGNAATQSFAQGDFNGDQRPDFFFADSDGTYKTLLGVGDGTFQSVPATGPFPTTGNRDPWRSTVARFDGDALDDIAVTHLNSPGVTVLLATGGGTFRAAAGSPFGTGNGDSVLSGDVDGDGHADLLFLNQAGSLAVLLGDGTGRFAPGPGPLALRAEAEIGIGRIDAGPSPDLVVESYPPATAQALLNDGSGSFSAGLGAAVATGTTYSSRPLVADLNHDGLGDVITSHSSSADNVVSVLLGAGSGILVPALGSPFPSGMIGPFSTSSPARMGSDDELDLVAAGTQSDQIAVMQGDGTGRLALMEGTPFPSGARLPLNSVIGDYNGDGINDIAYAVANLPRSVYVLLGRRAAILNRAELSFPPVAVSSASGAQTVHVTNTAAFAISFGGAAVGGPSAGDYARSADGCSGRTIAAGAGCDVSVRFLPSAGGARGATLSLPQDGDVLRVALSGSGIGVPAIPRLTAFGVSNKVFAAAPRARRAHATARRGRHGPKRGTTFRATTANARRLVIALDRPLPGRRAGGGCRRPSHANRGGRRCTRHVQAGTLVFPVRDGQNALRWSGRIGRRALPAGSYRATATSRENGRTSRARRVSFAIVRG